MLQEESLYRQRQRVLNSIESLNTRIIYSATDLIFAKLDQNKIQSCHFFDIKSCLCLCIYQLRHSFYIISALLPFYTFYRKTYCRKT